MANCWDPADEEKARIKWKEIRPGEEPTGDDLAPILGNRWNWANPTHMEAARQAWQAELPDREPLDDKAAAALGKNLDWAEIWHEIFKGDETVRLERISKVVRDFAAELDKDDPQPDSLQESEPSSLLAIEPVADSTPVQMQEADEKEAQWLRPPAAHRRGLPGLCRSSWRWSLSRDQRFMQCSPRAGFVQSR
jgi:hypothetical protein